jgi:hypothetical protein
MADLNVIMHHRPLIVRPESGREPSLYELVKQYYRIYFDEERAGELTAQYFLALSSELDC